MRKLLLFITGIFAIGAFMSCSGDEPKMAGTDADSSVREQFSANTNLRTLEEAAAIVRANMGILGETGSRSGTVRSFSPSSAKMVVNYGKSRAQLPDTLMYVFNFDNDEGFAVVAADRRLEGLIAITEKGSYDPAVGTDNPGLQYYMTAAEENLQLNDGDTDWQINGQNTHTDYYLHLNWGWNGTSNGWFNAGVFNPGHRAIPDTGTGVVNPDDYNDDYTIRSNLSVTTITL